MYQKDFSRNLCQQIWRGCCVYRLVCSSSFNLERHIQPLISVSILGGMCSALLPFFFFFFTPPSEWHDFGVSSVPVLMWFLLCKILTKCTEIGRLIKKQFTNIHLFSSVLHFILFWTFCLRQGLEWFLSLLTLSGLLVRAQLLYFQGPVL